MPLPLDTLNACVRVIGDVPAPDLVTRRKRGPIGSGFLLTVLSEAQPEFFYSYVVTAHHVIEDQSRIEVQLPDPLANGQLFEPFEVKDWWQPLENIDLAVALIPPGGHRGISLERQMLPRSGSPYLGSDVFYVGILEPLDRPMARRGTLGALDQIGVEHEGGYEFSCHLLDCRSYSGFSGSACFLHTMLPILEAQEQDANDPSSPAKPGDPPIGSMRHHCVLIGMITSHLEDQRPVGVASRYGIGVVLRSREIWEGLMTDEMRSIRKQLDAHNEKLMAKEQPSPKNVKAGISDESEFERFEDLTRTLVNTPKPEKGSADDQ